MRYFKIFLTFSFLKISFYLVNYPEIPNYINEVFIVNSNHINFLNMIYNLYMYYYIFSVSTFGFEELLSMRYYLIVRDNENNIYLNLFVKRMFNYIFMFFVAEVLLEMIYGSTFRFDYMITLFALMLNFLFWLFVILYLRIKYFSAKNVLLTVFFTVAILQYFLHYMRNFEIYGKSQSIIALIGVLAIIFMYFNLKNMIKTRGVEIYR